MDIKVDNITSTKNFTNSTCTPTVNIGEFTLYSLIPAALIVVVLSFTIQRVKRRHYCNGYPGLVHPIDFLRYDRNRFAHAAAFGATAGGCLQIFEKKFYIFGISASSSSWLMMLDSLAAVLVIGFSYYPIFACLSTDYEILGSVLGLFYTLSWLIIKLITVIECPNGMATDDNFIAYIGVPGYSVLSNLPEICCLSYISFTFIRNFMQRIRNQQTDTKAVLFVASVHQFAHVRSILKFTKRYYRNRNTDDTTQSSTTTKLVRKFMYHPKAEFKYPTRILATFLVAQIAVYKIAFVYGFVGFESFRILKGIFYVGEYLKLANVHNPKQNASLSETHRLFTLITQGIAVLQVSWTVATISSCLLILFYSLHMISCIRKHLLRLYCGSTSFLPQKKFSPTLTMAHSLRYSGYQIGYILWGFIISQVFLFVIAVLVAYFIVLPIMGEIPPVLLNFLVSIWPSIAFSAAAYFIQYLLSRYCLLKNRGKDGLVVDNRRLLSNAAYFLFFYNIILGLFSALFRLLESLVLGILFISRLDKSLLIRGYESWDSGYNAYLGFLHVEYHYNHPGAAVFCQLLIDSIKDDSSVNNRNSINTYVEEGHQASSQRANRTISRLARNRWLVAVTLLNNKSLIDHRRTKFIDTFTLSKRNNNDSDDDLLLFQE
ncbi:Stimulated by retinoic acid gene 6 protein-like protein [Trichoplax sp. H2]|nr:Stimulated by retinoic acid gene 6 protein-like protein [Trichoplax sp. H2]|eukprot:RDD46414.1 Stimulated by retinoic acid gene 6 protein-like protein [Trichoplax sp. H2]